MNPFLSKQAIHFLPTHDLPLPDLSSPQSCQPDSAAKQIPALPSSQAELPMPHFHSANFSSPRFSFLFLNPPLLEISISFPSSLCAIEAIDKSDWFWNVFLLVPPSLLHMSICCRPLAAMITFILTAWQDEAVTSNSWKMEFSVPSSKDFKKSKCRLYLSSAWWDGTLIGRRIIRTSSGDCSILAGMS